MHKWKIVLTVFSLLLLTGCTKEVENKDMSIMLNGDEIFGTFTGTLVDKMASGDGEFKASIDDKEEWVYTGAFENNTITGNGFFQNYFYELTIPNNSFDVIYNGECLNGLPNGKGKVQGEINSVLFEYEGEFLEGNLCGDGKVINYPCTISYENNEIPGLYTGKLLDGKITGNGEFTDTIDDVEFTYDGEWLDGNMSNLGHLTYDNYIVHFSYVDRNGAYDGETNNGIAEGEGTFEAVNDNNQKYIYTGSWNNGLYNGYGELHYIDSSDDIIDRIGTFTDGEFTPTPSEYMVYLSGSNKVRFEVSNVTNEFIKSNEIYFGDSAITDYPEELIQNISYKEYAKKAYAYQELFIETECKVENIWEYEMKTTVSNTMTEIYCNLPNDTFADFEIIYFGSLPDVYSGAKLKVIGIPVAYGSVTNVMGGQNACMFLLASQIEIL